MNETASEFIKVFSNMQVEEIEKVADIYEKDLNRYIDSLGLDKNKMRKLCDKIQRSMYICSLLSTLNARLN